MPPALERIVIVVVLVCLIVFGALQTVGAVIRRSISTSGQTVTPSSVDFWVYLFGYVFLFGMGVYGLVLYCNTN
jgi:hypothetical protein